MITFRSIAVVTVAILVPSLSSQTPERQSQGENVVVAIVDGQRISEAELDAWVGDKLMRLKTEEYGLRNSTLQEHIDNLLLAREAAKRNMHVDSLVRKEVTEKTPIVTEAEAQAVIEVVAGKYQSMSAEQALKLASEDLRQRRLSKRRNEFLASLRATYPSTVAMEPPRLTRPIAAAQGQAIGPTNAPVSIVEFSDFQCPFCSQLSATLERLHRDYPDQVQVVFKHFPVHQQATRAAEAAWCAAQQNRFWEMQKILFAETNLVATEQFEELAKRVRLDMPSFKDCLHSSHTTTEVLRDYSDGVSLGVSATPTLFVNGQMFVGTKPYEAFRGIIDLELQRSAVRSQNTATMATESSKK